MGKGTAEITSEKGDGRGMERERTCRKKAREAERE